MWTLLTCVEQNKINYIVIVKAVEACQLFFKFAFETELETEQSSGISKQFIGYGGNSCFLL